MKNEFELVKKKNVKKNKRSKKRHKKKSVITNNIIKIIFVIALSLVIISSSIAYEVKKVQKERIIEEQERKDNLLLESIKSHYSSIVKVNSDTFLYNENEEVVGTIYQDVVIELESIDITINTKYFKIKNSNYYIDYMTVSEIDGIIKNDNRYLSYIPFNENIITKDIFTLYQDGKAKYTFNKSMSFPIIIKNYEKKYYVEYDNNLYYIKEDDVLKTESANNTIKKNQKDITTLAYHMFYDKESGCNDPYVCMRKDHFDEEMKYLKDNNYLTLTMDELYMYLKGNIQVEKAVVITIDDGVRTKHMIDVLEKYNLYGTLFVITSITNNYDEYKSPNLLVQSHTDNMHRNYVCSGGNQGGAILCASEKAIKDDLQKSLTKLQIKPFALAYPFYDYNSKTIKVLKEMGFKMAFIGRAYTNGKATPNKTNLYQIPRMTVWDYSVMSFNEWKSYL